MSKSERGLALCLMAVLLSSCATTHEGPVNPIHGIFRHRVPFEVGHSEFRQGNAIQVKEMWGTRPEIEVGGSYLVIGRYELATHETAKLTFYETASGWDNTGPDIDSQVLRIHKGAGEFALIHEMPGPGWFHLSLWAAEGGGTEYIGNVYFGDGATLLKEIPW